MSRKELRLGLLFIIFVFFYFAAFGFLFTKSQNYTGVDVYTDELIKALLGAGTVAILTAVIFIFQARIEQRSKKEEEVFRVKLSFYSELIQLLEDIEKDGEIDEQELHKLHFISLRAVMFAPPEVFRALTEYHELCSGGNEERFLEKRYILINKISEEARNNLEVQDAIPERYQEDFRDSLEKIVSKAVQISEINKSERRQRRTVKEKLKIIEEYENYGEGRSRWLKDTHGLVPAYINTWRKNLTNDKD